MPPLVRLSRIEWVLLLVFLLWLGVGYGTIPSQFNLADLEHWGWGELTDTMIGSFIAFNLRWGDVILIGLAATQLHWVLCRRWGQRPAQVWAISLFLVGGLMEWVGVKTGWPFGPYHYSHWLGPSILGLIPAIIPVAWYVIITLSLLCARQWAGHRSRFTVAGIAGIVAVLYDWVLEPFAWRIRAYWIWHTPTVPVINYLSWFFLTSGLVALLAPHPEWKPGAWDFRPVLILGGFLGLFTLTRIVHGI